MYDEQEYMRADEAHGAAESRRWAREMQDEPTSAQLAAAFAPEPSIAGMVQTFRCPECDGSGRDAGALFEPEPCPLCLGAGELAAPELVDTLFFDHDNQAWVMDGLYIGCCHSQRCGCYGKLHAGETYQGRAA